LSAAPTSAPAASPRRQPSSRRSSSPTRSTTSPTSVLVARSVRRGRSGGLGITWLWLAIFGRSGGIIGITGGCSRLTFRERVWGGAGGPPPDTARLWLVLSVWGGDPPPPPPRDWFSDKREGTTEKPGWGRDRRDH